MARPKLEIDASKVEELAEIGATNQEIASIVGCCVDTLTDRFSDVLDKGRSSGKTRLRMLQWHSAKSGNVTMQIWLGKQLLGQSDKAETRNTHDFTALTDADLIARVQGTLGADAPQGAVPPAGD